MQKVKISMEQAMRTDLCFLLLLLLAFTQAELECGYLNHTRSLDLGTRDQGIDQVPTFFLFDAPCSESLIVGLNTTSTDWTGHEEVVPPTRINFLLRPVVGQNIVPPSHFESAFLGIEKCPTLDDFDDQKLETEWSWEFYDDLSLVVSGENPTLLLIRLDFGPCTWDFNQVQYLLEVRASVGAPFLTTSLSAVILVGLSPAVAVYLTAFCCARDEDASPDGQAKKVNIGPLSGSEIKQLVIPGQEVTFDANHRGNEGDRLDIFRSMARGELKSLELSGLPTTSEEWDFFRITLVSVQDLTLLLTPQDLENFPDDLAIQATNLLSLSLVQDKPLAPEDMRGFSRVLAALRAPRLDHLVLMCPSSLHSAALMNMLKSSQPRNVTFEKSIEGSRWTLSVIVEFLELVPDLETLELVEDALVANDYPLLVDSICSALVPQLKHFLFSGCPLDNRSLEKLPEFVLHKGTVSLVSLKDATISNKEMADLAFALSLIDKHLDRNVTFLVTQTTHPFRRTILENVRDVGASSTFIEILSEDVPSGWLVSLQRSLKGIIDHSSVRALLWLYVLQQLLLSSGSFSTQEPSWIVGLRVYFTTWMAGFTDFGIPLTALVLLCCGIFLLSDPFAKRGAFLDWMARASRRGMGRPDMSYAVAILLIVVAIVLFIAGLVTGFAYLLETGSILLVGSGCVLPMILLVDDDTDVSRPPVGQIFVLLNLLTGPFLITSLVALAENTSCYLLQEPGSDADVGRCMDAPVLHGSSLLAMVLLLVSSALISVGGGSVESLLYPENREGLTPWKSLFQLLLPGLFGNPTLHVPRTDILQSESARFSLILLVAKFCFAVIPVWFIGYTKLGPSLLLLVSVCVWLSVIAIRPYRAPVDTASKIMFGMVVIVNVVVVLEVWTTGLVSMTWYSSLLAFSLLLSLLFFLALFRATERSKDSVAGQSSEHQKWVMSRYGLHWLFPGPDDEVCSGEQFSVPEDKMTTKEELVQTSSSPTPLQDPETQKPIPPAQPSARSRASS